MASILALGKRLVIISVGYRGYSRWGIPSRPVTGRFGYSMDHRYLVLIDQAVPIVVGAVILTALLIHGGDSASAGVIALGLSASAVLWARRRFPAPTLVASGALVALLLHEAPAAATVAVLAPAVALYSLALTRGRREQLVAGGAAILAVIATDLAHSGKPTVLQTLAHVLLVAIPLLAAEAIRTHRSYMAVVLERLELSERSREVEAARRVEQERLRIARELHDVVAHTLTAVNVQAGAAAETVTDQHAREALERVEVASHDALQELRAILGVLRDPGDGGGPLSPPASLDDLQALISRLRLAGSDLTVEITGERATPVSDATSLAAYRIIQESLTNAQRHAPGAPVRVSLTYDPTSLTISIENRIAVTGATRSDHAGVGLVGMRERASTVGGSLQTSTSEHGFLVVATLPLESRR